MANPWDQDYPAKKQANPWEQDYPSSSTPAPGADTAEAGLAGAAKGITLNYMPELEAVAAYPAMKIQQGYEAITGQPQLPDVPYADRVKMFREQQAQSVAKNPTAATAGEVAGSFLAPVPGIAEAKGAGILGKIATGAASGAAYGALRNTESTSDQNGNINIAEDLKQRGLNALTGAGFGAGGTAAAEGASAAGNALAGGLNKAGELISNTSIFKQIGANAGQIKKILKKDDLPRIDNFLNKENLMKPGTTLDQVAEKTKNIIDQDGPKIGQLYRDAQDAANTVGIGQSARIDGNQLADDIVQSTANKFKNHTDRDRAIKEMQQAVLPLRDMGENADLSAIHDFRKSLDENVNWTGKNSERPAVEQAYINARNIVNDKSKGVINALDNAVGGDKLALLKKLNDRYSAASTVNNIATQGVGREMAKVLGVQGAIGGMVGLGVGGEEFARTGDPFLAAKHAGMAMGGLYLGRRYAAPLGYGLGKAMQGTGNAMQNIGQKLPEVNPGRIGAMVSPYTQPIQQYLSPWLKMQGGQ